MKLLTVFAFIFLGFYLIGCIRAHVIISVKKYLEIYVKVFFMKIRVSTSHKPLPPDEELDLPVKKPKEKKEPKEKKDKSLSKENKEKAKKTKKDEKKLKKPKKAKIVNIHIDIPKMLEMLRDVLGAIFLKLWRYFRVRVKNFHITVASEDAATTAMMYGAICGFGNEIMTILEKALDFQVEKGAKVGASCDYFSDEMKMDIEIDISITIGNVFRYIFGIVGTALAGALRGIKIRINKDYFKQKKKYKKELALYNERKAELERSEEEKAAKKAEKESKEAEKGAETEGEAPEEDADAENAEPSQNGENNE